MIADEPTQSFRVHCVQDKSSPSSSSPSVSPPAPPHDIVQIHPQLPTYHSINPDDDDNNNIQPIHKVKARCEQDPSTGVHQNFILWSDVRVLIKDAEYALDGEDGSLIPFMVDDNYEE